MVVVDPKELIQLQSQTENVRNICIIAHVDHGKTTLSDFLIASNGIISANLSGKIRYLDSRPDEQQKAITMKASSISLLYKNKKDEKYIVNLIDSPGHVDFSSEVSSAARLTDGAILLVDALEGVRTQTKAVLQQAFKENIKPCLMLNKIDRLFLEKQMTPQEAYQQMLRILEQVNAIMSQVKSAHLMMKSEEKEDGYIEEEVDSDTFFSPERGNVLFGCAADGWGFRINHFAEFFSKKLGLKRSVLQKTLWGEYYLDAKTKKIKRKASRNATKPLFVQCILDNIWQVYHSVNSGNLEKVKKIIKTLNLEVGQNILKKQNKQLHLQAIMRAWLPLADSVLEMVCDCLPTPIVAQRNRISHLMPDLQKEYKGEKTQRSEIRKYRRKLKKNLLQCDKSENAEICVFVSKMLEVDTLPGAVSAQKQLQRREYKRGLHKQEGVILNETMEESKTEDKEEQNQEIKVPEEEIKVEEKKEDIMIEESNDLAPILDDEEEEEEEKQYFVGFARIFSGTIKIGQKLHILGPRYSATHPNEHRHEFVVEQLYLLMGRDLEPVTEVPAGNIFGIGGISKYVIKTATISSSIYSPVFSAMYFQAAPIVRYAIEPEKLSDMPKLVRGLKLLHLSDPCVRVMVQETGEHVIMTAGEIHAERCFRDLNEKFAKIPIAISPPLVGFRETIIANENNKQQTFEVQTANKQCKIKIRAIPLPFNIARFIDDNQDRIRKCVDTSEQDQTTELISIEVFEELKKEFETVGEKWLKEWENVWSLGPRRTGPNILLNHIKEYHDEHFRNYFERIEDPISNIKKQQEEKDEFIKKLTNLDNAIVTGFQMATISGPLCDEPMMGTCFCIEEVEFTSEEGQEISFESIGTFSGQIVSAIREGCRKSFDSNPRRLVEAMYKCDIQTPISIIGNVYAVLSSRRAKILGEDVEEGTGLFTIKSLLPVAESFGFINELRDKTSGAASPHLLFSHWEILDVDPFYVPKTKEEIEEFGVMEEGQVMNIAKKYVDQVRKRKGLLVREKLVERADAQRTLSKKK